MRCAVTAVAEAAPSGTAGGAGRPCAEPGRDRDDEPARPACGSSGRLDRALHGGSGRGRGGCRGDRGRGGWLLHADRPFAQEVDGGGRGRLRRDIRGLGDQRLRSGRRVSSGGRHGLALHRDRPSHDRERERGHGSWRHGRERARAPGRPGRLGRRGGDGRAGHDGEVARRDRCPTRGDDVETGCRLDGSLDGSRRFDGCGSGTGLDLQRLLIEPDGGRDGRLVSGSATRRATRASVGVRPPERGCPRSVREVREGAEPAEETTGAELRWTDGPGGGRAGGCRPRRGYELGGRRPRVLGKTLDPTGRGGRIDVVAQGLEKGRVLTGGERGREGVQMTGGLGLRAWSAAGVGACASRHAVRRRLAPGRFRLARQGPAPRLAGATATACRVTPAARGC